MTGSPVADHRTAPDEESGRRTALPVVVGVDGSDAALDAAAWGARVAEATHSSERLVHALVVPEWIAAFVYTPAPTEDTLDHELTVRGEHLLTTAAAAATACAPGVTVTTRLVHGAVGDVLAAQSERAQMVVVGTPPADTPSPGALAGTVTRLIRRSRCPVVVHRASSSDRPHGATIIVGHDGSEHADTALTRALALARALALPVRVLHAFHLSPRTMLETKAGFLDWDSMASARAHWLRTRVEPTCADFDDVPVSTDCVDASAPEALITQSAPGDILVVGARGLNRAAGVLLGSVSQSVLHHAPCTVMVVR